MCCNSLGDTEAAMPAIRRFLEVAPPEHPDVPTAVLEYLE
jgi:NADPH-dependent ferric siderophore reductase